METRLLNGNKIATEIKTDLAAEILELKKKELVPGLGVILVGDDPASGIYVRGKAKTCQELGMRSELVELPGSISTMDLLREVGKLNNDDGIDGVLVQLPLPPQIDEQRVLAAIHPAKDVDGFHPLNAGKVFLGRQALAPCTPRGIVDMLQREGFELKGLHAVIVGRSNIVGKPLAILLLEQHCTVTICHSRTQNLPEVCKNADLLVAAVGRPALVTKDFIKEGAIVVDVGTNRLTSREEVVRLFGEDSPRLLKFDEKGSTLVGDVHPRDPLGIARALTPVPGGVGPLTIAHLMKNTVLACRSRRAEAPLVKKAGGKPPWPEP